MLADRSQYFFVSEKSLGKVSVTGSVLPVREQKPLLLLEDIAFLKEAVEERVQSPEDSPSVRKGSVDVGMTRISDSFQFLTINPSQFVDRRKLEATSFAKDSNVVFSGKPVTFDHGVDKFISDEVSKITVYDAVNGLKETRPWFYSWRFWMLFERVYSMLDSCVIPTETPFLHEIDRGVVGVETTTVDENYNGEMHRETNYEFSEFLNSGTQSTETRKIGDKISVTTISKSYELKHARIFVRIGKRNQVVKAVSAIVEISANGTGGSISKVVKVPLTKFSVPYENFLKEVDDLEDIRQTERGNHEQELEKTLETIEEEYQADIEEINRGIAKSLEEIDEKYDEMVVSEREKMVRNARSLMLSYNSTDDTATKENVNDQIRSLYGDRDTRIEEINAEREEKKAAERKKIEQSLLDASRSREQKILDARKSSSDEWDTKDQTHLDAISAALRKAQDDAYNRRQVILSRVDQLVNPTQSQIISAQVQAQNDLAEVLDIDPTYREVWVADVKLYGNIGSDLLSNPQTEVNGDTTTVMRYFSTMAHVKRVFAEFEYKTLTGAEYPDYKAIDDEMRKRTGKTTTP